MLKFAKQNESKQESIWKETKHPLSKKRNSTLLPFEKCAHENKTVQQRETVI